MPAQSTYQLTQTTTLVERQLNIEPRKLQGITESET